MNRPGKQKGFVCYRLANVAAEIFECIKKYSCTSDKGTANEEV